MQHITVVPAYGRRLTAQNAVEAYGNGKDFMIIGAHPEAGRYVSKREAQKYGLILHCVVMGNHRSAAEETIVLE